jgi:hypothetical protein
VVGLLAQGWTPPAPKRVRQGSVVVTLLEGIDRGTAWMQGGARAGARDGYVAEVAEEQRDAGPGRRWRSLSWTCGSPGRLKANRPSLPSRRGVQVPPDPASCTVGVLTVGGSPLDRLRPGGPNHAGPQPHEAPGGHGRPRVVAATCRPGHAGARHRLGGRGAGRSSRRYPHRARRDTRGRAARRCWTGPGRRSHDRPGGDRLAQVGCNRRGGRDARPAHPAPGGAGQGAAAGVLSVRDVLSVFLPERVHQQEA